MGATEASAIFLAVIVILVSYMTIANKAAEKAVV